jgi:hypothetical protein
MSDPRDAANVRGSADWLGVDVTDGTWQSKGSKGAASELIACAYLMRQGWHAFRCESPASPFDLVAYRDGEFLRVEVKSISRARRARTHLDPDPIDGANIPWPSNDEWDLLVAVDPDGCDCVEITTHDYREGINLLRKHYGLPPVGQVRSTQIRERYPRLAEQGLP